MLARISLIATLILAGELVFGLPFHTARFFRPTMLDVFEFTNTQLGDLFAVYGITAMLSYFPGGALADRFSARGLLTVSLLATGAGGLYMATIPGAAGMAVLYAYWGVTSIFLFWGALIRATRDWGGTQSQGKAFGILEAGRGVVAASVAFVAIAVFAWQMPEIVESASDEQRRWAFRQVILVYSLVTMLTAILTWFLIPVPEYRRTGHVNPLSGMAIVLQRPVVWAHAAVIVCAYCGYKGLDNYSLYAAQVLGMNEIDAARFATWGSYLRPVAAIAAGVIADRYDAARSIGVIFVVMLVSYSALSTLAPATSGTEIVVGNLLVTFFAVFALRGIYYALLEENGTPKLITGATVGLVSVVGYTPEIFFAPIGGRILDAAPGVEGHQNYFLFLAALSASGIAVIAWLLWLRSRGVESLWRLRPGAEIKPAA
ncbi:MAG: MFS transporter [Woeseiaceae bacterium]|nr:MFS transporter [Woeseiaceae bacterium]